MNSNSRLVKHLIDSRVLVTASVIKAFEKMDRCDFLPTHEAHNCYIDHALPIGYNQTISQPTTVAIMLELLQPQNGNKILDVGSGSGWTTALLSSIVGPKGNVIGLERVPELVEFGKDNLKKYSIKNAEIIKASKKLGHSKEVPFDKILVSAASNELPLTLIEQLTIGGIMVIPIKNFLTVIKKRGETDYSRKDIYGFAFVPLIYED